MRHAKCISMFLALATLAAFVSCGSGAEEKPTVTTEGVDKTVTVGDNTEETRLEPDLPDVRYDGKTLRFLSRTSTDKVVRYYSEVRSDEENGETMNDAVFARTLKIEEKYGVTISEERVDDPSATYKRSFLAGDDNWEVVVESFSRLMPLAATGEYFTDINSIRYIDLENPWWNTQTANDLSVSGKVFAAIGAMNTWTDSHTNAVVFNKELAEQYSIDPYGMVDRNEWTIDNFSALTKDVTNDLDGNGTMDENDRYGACGDYFEFLVMMTGCCADVVDHDENGIPRYNVGENFYSAAEKVSATMNSGDWLLAEKFQKRESDPWTNILRKNFRAGNTLFYFGGIEQLLIFRDLDTDIGLLPVPKYDAGSEYRHTFTTYWSSIMAVSPISPEQEMTGVLLEAMNAESYYGDAMAYYDVVLKHKAMRDEDSIRMLEIIRSTRTMNFEYAFGYLGLQSVYNDVLNKGDVTSLTSKIASKLPAAEKKLDKAIGKITEKQ